jgi:hypothetical protein
LLPCSSLLALVLERFLGGGCPSLSDDVILFRQL